MIANVHIDDRREDIVLEVVVVAKAVVVAPSLACIFQIERVGAMPDHTHDVHFAKADLKFPGVT